MARRYRDRGPTAHHPTGSPSRYAINPTGCSLEASNSQKRARFPSPPAVWYSLTGMMNHMHQQPAVCLSAQNRPLKSSTRPVLIGLISMVVSFVFKLRCLTGCPRPAEPEVSSLESGRISQSRFIDEPSPVVAGPASRTAGAAQKIAIGFQGEPVAPGRRSGRPTTMNSKRPSCSQASASSSSCRLSEMHMPMAVSCSAWIG
jgi:hypothetical protein